MRIEKDGVVVEENTPAVNTDEKLEAKTAKCPECGGKYLPETGYCPSCKKKVGGKKEEVEETELEESKGKLTPDEYKAAMKAKKIDEKDYIFDTENKVYIKKESVEEENEIIEIPEEVKLTQEDGSVIILEKGDKIQIVKEESEPEEAEPEE